jgi:hypothetical protein
MKDRGPLAATRQYPGQLVSTANECPSAICTVRRVSASAVPNTSPAAQPVSVARGRPERRRPAITSSHAVTAMPAAVGQ